MNGEEGILFVKNHFNGFSQMNSKGEKDTIQRCFRVSISWVRDQDVIIMQSVNGHYARDSSSDPSNKSWSPLENSLRACLNICWDEPSLNDAAANYFYQGSQE